MERHVPCEPSCVCVILCSSPSLPQMVVSHGASSMQQVLGLDADRTAALVQACQTELEDRLQKVQTLRSLSTQSQEAGDASTTSTSTTTTTTEDADQTEAKRSK